MPFINKFLLLIVLLLCHSVTAATEQLSYLIISEQAEPFQINNDKTKHQSGVISEIVDILAKQKPFVTVNQVMPFKRYLYEMKQQSYPNWISYGSPSWRAQEGKQLQNKRLSKHALFIANHVAVSLKQDKPNVSPWSQLQHKTVILLKGFKYPGLPSLIDKYQMNVLEVNSHKSALLALQGKRGDLFIEMKSRILYSLKEHQIDASTFEFTNINHVIAPVAIHLSYGESVAQSLIDWIDQHILIMKANGKIEAIIKQYQ